MKLKAIVIVVITLLLGACNVDTAVEEVPSEIIVNTDVYEAKLGYWRGISKDRYFSIITKNNINYISINDLIELIQFSNKDLLVDITDDYIDISKENNTIKFNIIDNKIEANIDHVYAFYSTTKDDFANALYDVYKNVNTNIDINLDDFGIKYIVEEEVFIPFELASFIMFGKDVNMMILENKLRISHHFPKLDTNKYKKLKEQEALTKEEMQYYYNLFLFHLEYNYSYIDVDIDLLRSIYSKRLSICETKDEFYKLMFDMYYTMLYDYEDLHFVLNTLGKVNLESVFYYASLNQRVDLNELYSGYNSNDDNVVTHEIVNDVVHIRIPTYSISGVDEAVYNILKTNNNKKVIIDVRGNGGGYLTYELFNYITTKPLKQYIKLDQGSEVIHEISLSGDKSETFGEFSDRQYVWLTDDACFSQCSVASLLFKNNNLGKIVGEDTRGGHTAMQLGADMSQSNVIFSDGTSFYLPNKYVWSNKDGEEVNSVKVDYYIENNDDTIDVIVKNFDTYFK